ncbi:MAG: HD domain-containing protein [Desulfosarcina sp.]
MHSDRLNLLKAWFESYTGTFLTGETIADSPLTLKIDHSARVCQNMRRLGRSINLTQDRISLAQAIGLFHDLGRFAQYRRYRTFNDSQSVNHAVLSIDALKKTGVLDELPAEEKTIITDAIRFHNAPALPNNKPPPCMIFMRLIRDADKLDIWKVFADVYRHHRHPESAIVQHLPDRPGWSDEIVKAVRENRMARLQDMRTLNDFKLLQLSWVFDLNFPETMRQARKRGDLAAIAETLPDDRELQDAMAGVMERLDNCIGSTKRFDDPINQ